MPNDTRPRRVEVNGMLPLAVPELAAKIANLHGLTAIATLGWPTWSPTDAYPNLRLLRLSRSEDENPPSIWHGTGLAVDLVSDAIHVAPALPQHLGSLIAASPVSMIRVSEQHEQVVLDVLADVGTTPSFAGRTTVADGSQAVLLVVDHVVGAPGAPPPNAEFRVLAVITTFNEEDIIATTIDALRRDGVDVHIVDNWSTDATFEIATRYAESGAITLERFPTEPPSTFNHGDLLRRIETIALGTTADWVIHHDADERRRPPWAGMSMRDALWLVQRSGFNAVNHTVLTFRPVDDGWLPGIDPEEHLRFFELEPRPDLMLQVRAWKRTPELDLASSGGHEARFAGQRVFPYHFLLKHYPLRSQEQAERKIFQDRRGRWNAEERSKGWHHHYDDAREGQNFLWEASRLIEFVDGQSERDYLIPLIGGPEVGQPWALKARRKAIEDEALGRQSQRVQDLLERRFGPRVAKTAVKFVRLFTWTIRPIRRALARRAWRRSRSPKP